MRLINGSGHREIRLRNQHRHLHFRRKKLQEWAGVDRNVEKDKKCIAFGPARQVCVEGKLGGTSLDKLVLVHQRHCTFIQSLSAPAPLYIYTAFECTSATLHRAALNQCDIYRLIVRDLGKQH